MNPELFKAPDKKISTAPELGEHFSRMAGNFSTPKWESATHAQFPTVHLQLNHWLRSLENDARTPTEFLMQEGETVVLVRRTTERALRGCGPAIECLAIVGFYLPDHLQGQGRFKQFLKLCVEVKPWPSLAIELVVNPRLLAFCQQLRFETPDPDDETTFLVDADAVRLM